MVRTFLALVVLVSFLHSAAAQPDTPSRAPRERPAIEADSNLAIVDVEILVAEWNAPGDDAPAPVDLSGATVDVAKRVAGLEKQEKLSVIHRMRLTSVDGQTGMLQLGERRPRVTAVAGFGGGRGPSSSVNFESVGTMVSLTPHVHANDSVTMTLNIEKSGPRMRADSPVIGDSPMGEKVRVESTATLTIQTVVRLASGQTAVVAGMSGGEEQYVVLVAAKVTR